MIRIFCSFLLMLLLTNTARGGEVAHLYNLSLLVPLQSAEPSAEQARKALTAVLVKVSGQRQVLGKPAVQQALDQAAQYLRGFSFKNTNRAIKDAQGNPQQAQRLLMEFDSSLIDGLLAQSGSAVLNDNRPTLMVWLVAERGGFRDYVSPDSPLLTRFMATAAERGLPIQMPLLDLTDQQNLPITDLWGLFDDRISYASKRYRPDAILSGRLTELPNGGWNIDWLLLNSGNVERFSEEGSIDQLLPLGVERVADTLFTRENMGVIDQVAEKSQDSGLLLDIDNVRNLAAVLALTDSIKKLSVVESAHPVEVDGGRILLKLELKGSFDQLQQALKLEPRLSVLDVIRTELGERVTSVRLRWQGR